MLSEGLLDAHSIVSVIDEAPGERVIVTGTLPPEGRDLDLLVTDRQAQRLREVLAAHGFLPRGRTAVPVRLATQQWVRVKGCSALAVDLNPMSRWGLSTEEEHVLAAEAVPIEGCHNLARPSPYHVVLILARRLAGGTLPHRLPEKLAAAVAADPGVWERAEERAKAWSVRAALPALRRLHDEGLPPTRMQRMRALLEVTRAAGISSATRKSVGKSLAARPRQPRVVGFSGLDGSGKSSQVRALITLLEQLDVAVVAEWKPLGHNSSIRAIRRVVKRALIAAHGLDANRLELSKRPGHSLIAGANPALFGGRQNPVLTHLWSTMVCLASAGHYRMVTLRHAGSGRLIVFDRFALDTIAQLRFFYGPEHRFAFQRALVRVLCPEPLAAWLLDVPAEVALARKPEQYDVAQLKQQEKLLREEAARLGVTRLDGTQPMAELCHQIATEVWKRTQ